MSVNTKEKVEVHIFQVLKYNLTDNHTDILLDISSGPDLNFFKHECLNTPYFLLGDIHNVLNEFSSKTFSILHINIRSINKNFQNFKFFLSFLSFTFSIIYFSETWFDDSIFTSTSLHKLPNYVSTHQITSDHKVVGVSFYIHKSSIFKIRNYLNVSTVKFKLQISASCSVKM